MVTDNSLLNGLKEVNNYKETENGAIAYKSTLDAVYDMFAFGGAYRKRSDADCILLFKKAFEQDEVMALKCLFYLRDVRGGQGERRFFRVCFKWLCDTYPEAAKRNLDNVSEFGRWDDLIYAAADTKLEDYMLFKIKEQLVLDLECKTPSLLGKWLPSENASSYTTTKMANKIRKYLKMTHKEYRKALSVLRTRINIVEKLMSENRWDEIEFDKIPSKAGLIYRNAFSRRDLIQQKYKEFIKSEKTTVNAKTLYPYDIVSKAVESVGWGYNFKELSQTDRIAIEKYWNNQKDYFNGKPCEILAVIDTSGSMTDSRADAPLNVALSLGMYCAERMNGAFKNHFITFSRKPELIEFEGIDFVDKVRRVYKRNQCENTNLTAVFNLLKNMVVSGKAKAEDLPAKIVVISDMSIDSGANDWSDSFNRWSTTNTKTTMEKIRQEWNNAGLKMPSLTYWNVNARESNILDSGSDVSFVSGCSPVLFEQVLRGVTGVELMLDKLNSTRYECIK